MTFDGIAAALVRGFGIELTRFEELTGGLDPQASNWLVSSSTGDQYVLKISTSPSPSLALSSMLAAVGIAEVLAPIPTVTGQSALAEDGAFYLLFPFVAGTNGFQVPLKALHWVQVGRALRQIHDFPLAEVQAIPAERFEVAGIPEFFRLAGRISTSEPKSRAEQALANCLNAHFAQIEKVLARVRELGAWCCTQSWQTVPCHADLHVGNILITREDQVWIIDWDTSRLAPRECDFIFFLDGGITGHGPEPEAAFWEGYGTYEPNRRLLAYYRYVRAAEDIVSFSREAIDPLVDETKQLEAVRYLDAIFKPGMIVEVAMDTD